MRLRNLRTVFVIAFGLALLDSPPSSAVPPIPLACNASDCLNNSAYAQRIQPTTVGLARLYFTPAPRLKSTFAPAPAPLRTMSFPPTSSARSRTVRPRCAVGGR